MNASEVDVRFAAFVRDGDPADLAAVFDALAPDLLLLAAHVSWSGTDAEDLVQATFVTAIERRDDYDTSRPVRPWLVGILVNHARNSNRKVRRELVGEQGVQGVSADASRDDAAGPADAAVTQEVLAAVTSKVEAWDPDHCRGSFRGWLFRVARNIAVDRIHAQSRQARASGDSRIVQLLAQTPERAEAESEVFWAEYRRKLFHWAAEKIRPEVRETSWQSFWLTSVDGVKPEQAAEQLGVSLGSVYAARFRIIARLREIVSRFDESDDGEDSILKSIRSLS